MHLIGVYLRYLPFSRQATENQKKKLAGISIFWAVLFYAAVLFIGLAQLGTNAGIIRFPNGWKIYAIDETTKARTVVRESGDSDKYAVTKTY